MGFKKKDDSEGCQFICKITGDACKLVTETQEEFQQKYFKGRKRMELGKARATQILLDELAEIKKKENK